MQLKRSGAMQWSANPLRAGAQIPHPEERFLCHLYGWNEVPEEFMGDTIENKWGGDYHAFVRELIDLLPNEMMRYVVQARYGLRDGYAHTGREVADVLSISQNRVSQIEKKAFRMMRHPKRRKDAKNNVLARRT